MEKRLSQSNKGFTIAEICVTMVIVSVLASITTFGLINWQHESTYNKAEQSAELIYMALKNKMAIYIANDITLDFTQGCLFCNNDDYGKYKVKNSDPNASQEKAWILFDSIKDYIYDKTLLNAYIFVEFENGSIKSVYYSDRTKFFNSSGTNSASLNNSYVNNESKRYDDLVGVYRPE